MRASAVVVLLVGSICTAAAVCPGGADYERDGYCWKFVTTNAATDRAGAEADCSSWQGHLATLSSSGDKQAAIDRIAAMPYQGSWWIGLHREDGGDPWEWQDGAEFAYTSWSVGQPDDFNDNQNCVTMTSAGLWEDTYCYSTATAWVCKKPDTQECSGTAIMQARSGTLSENAFLHYSHSNECVWIINPPGQETVVLSLSFDTEADHDSITIYDGDARETALASMAVLGAFSGNSYFERVESTGHAMTVVWSTDAAINSYTSDNCLYTRFGPNCVACGSICSQDASCGTEPCNGRLCGCGCCESWSGGCDGYNCGCSTCYDRCTRSCCHSCEACVYCDEYEILPYEGFTASYTSHFTCDDCSGNATCDAAAGTCTCNEGYEGSGFTCTDINECDENVCGANADCTNTAGSYSCQCWAGFENAPDCTNIDECSEDTDNCAANAACTDAEPFFSCQCNFGYSGDPTTACTDIDECLQSACGANTTCVNLEVLEGGDLGYNCACWSGYEGNAYGAGCGDVDECAQGVCDGNATCSNLPGSVACSCNGGYSGGGLLGDCADIDECLANPCDPLASCSNFAGGFDCECPPGYHGNGFTCTNVNECQYAADNDCDSAHGLCVDNDGSFSCTCVSGWTNSSDGNPSGVNPALIGYGTTCYDEDECNFGTDSCLAGSTCKNVQGFYQCFGNELACTEAEGLACHQLAYCEEGTCMCPEGVLGSGFGADGCTTKAWTVRFSFRLPTPFNPASIVGGKLATWATDKADYIALFPPPLPDGFATSMEHSVTLSPAGVPTLTINALFPSAAEAEAARLALSSALDSRRRTPPTTFGVALDASAYETEPRVYSWVTRTTSDGIGVLPTGMEVELAYFEPNCMQSGCWVLELIATLGEGTFNALYLPRAVGDDALSYDFNYNVPGQVHPSYGHSVQDTFQPSKFPCRTHDYTPDPSAGSPPKEVTACCFPGFIDLYRPIEGFVDTWDLPQFRNYSCEGDDIPLILPKPNIGTIDPSKTYIGRPPDAIEGNFSGMNYAKAVFASTEDPYLRQYRVILYLDEVELRQKAGMLSGTVGVEHAVDTFIGFVNFKATGQAFVDPFATQVNLHFEKTSFFTVSTHGVNDYTFLEYVNLRLVAIYDEDTDLTETNPDNADRITRTNSTAAAHYLQVTFTLGAQYQPIETGLIPLDSVRVGQGTFTATATSDGSTPGMAHACVEYKDGNLPRQSIFDSRLPQPCAPGAAMCESPASVPDQFVVFNVPLGVDWLPEASNDLANNVFVHLVVSAIDTTQIAAPTGTPNDGDAPEQMKTTLSASIPVVDGGVNVFCDGIVAKTDLKDVADADLILGSAMTTEELSRLTILQDIGSTDLSSVASRSFATDSIEAGLMTLVLKGDDTYFGRAGTGSFALQLEDVVTIHIMEPASGTAATDVAALLALPGDDNSFSSGLDTNGYALNGALHFTIDRATGTASLEPSGDLLALCPFNPPRPSVDVLFPSTCVTRRDVRAQGFPARTGAVPTATEIQPLRDTPLGPVVGPDDAKRDGNGEFMQTVMGSNSYAMALGKNYSYVVAAAYGLNGRSKRAFWINPGYEWTPTQTGGQSRFSVSQKIFFFALVRLDEGFGSRRRLLSNVEDVDMESGMSAAELSFDVSQSSFLAKVASLPSEFVASFALSMSISERDACLDLLNLKASLRGQLEDLIQESASEVLTVQVASVLVDRSGVDCGGGRRAMEGTTAEVEILVAFAHNSDPAIDLATIRQDPAIHSISALELDPEVINVDGSNEVLNRPGDIHTPKEEKDEGDDHGTLFTAGVAMVTAGGVAMLAAAVFALVVKRRYDNKAEQLVPVSVATRSYLKSELASEIMSQDSS